MTALHLAVHALTINIARLCVLMAPDIYRLWAARAQWR